MALSDGGKTALQSFNALIPKTQQRDPIRANKALRLGPSKIRTPGCCCELDAREGRLHLGRGFWRFMWLNNECFTTQQENGQKQATPLLLYQRQQVT